ncbi:MAG: GDSL-type esterase/lipase family protein [Myxococcota bacterium]|nr:GDSL-type esterase/lipase family protein [Myxococcota bacterium]
MVRSLCFAALLFAPASAYAQASSASHGEGVEHLRAFHEALDALPLAEPGDHVRIAWWGDSAIVGDGYTGEVRRLLQSRFGDGGPGFALTAPDFSGYLRKGVRFKRHHWEVASVLKGGRKDGHYGYGGVVSTSYGGAGSSFITPEPRIDRVHVYHRATARTGALQLFIDGGPRPTAELSKTRGEVGDRVWTVPLESPASSVRLRAGGGGRSTVYGVALERTEPGVVLDALGLVGLRARRWRKADEAHLHAQVASRGVALLVLAFGGNERVDPALSVDRHATAMIETVRRFRAGAPEASCLIVGPIAHAKGRTSRLDPRLKTVYAAQRQAASTQGCAFFDTVAAMGGEESVARFRSGRLLGRDLAHLTPRGHEVVGGLLSDWLLAGYDAR